MVMMSGYAPNRGDIVWINLDPQAGHEQAGRRPALVLSPISYNRKVGLALLCPITNHIKQYPFETVIPQNEKVNGAILCDQLKSLDWRIRKKSFICRIPTSTLEEVLKKINTLISIE